ncbi:MAG TPA: hypothetical protein VN905_03715 [Candidatus Binatia bacterium]|nr:hypothetical protein [Candidatus Binatia bacterium]
MKISEENAKRVDWQGILAFVMLTIALTWPAEIMAYLKGVRFGGTSAADQSSAFLLIAVTVVPAFSAWIVRATATKEGFATAGLRMGRWQYFALTWIAVPWIYLVIYGSSLALGLARFNPAFAQFAPAQISWTLAASLSLFIVPALVPAFGSQFGWTGFVLPKLLPLGRWPAAIGYGLLWGATLLPLAALGYLYAGYPAGYVLIVLFTCALGMVEAALRIRAGSLYLSIFFAAAFSSQAHGIAPVAVFVTQPLLGGIAGIVGIVVLAAIGAWLLATTPQAAIDAILAQPAKSRAKRTGRSRSA